MTSASCHYRKDLESGDKDRHTHLISSSRIFQWVLPNKVSAAVIFCNHFTLYGATLREEKNAAETS